LLSVVVTSYKDLATCYLTVAGVQVQLEGKGIDYEIIVVADGGTETKWENRGLRCLRGNFGSPQDSRDAGINLAKYPNVLLLESHVVVSDISQLLLEHQRLESQITFPIRVWEGTELFNVFAHETNWDGDLWVKRAIYAEVRKVAYPVAQFGHSCFMLDRNWYLSSGGYTSLLTGWGGEEPLLCLKTWMMGGEVWQVPSVWHMHYLTPGAHREKPHLEHNLLIVKYLMTGRKENGLKLTPAIEAERQKICRGPFAGDLSRLRAHLRLKGAPYA